MKRISSSLHVASKQVSGSATLVALLVVFVASFVLAGWAMILAARVESSEQASVAQKRRIAIQNSKNMAVQWARSGLSVDAISPISTNLEDGWGGIESTNSMSGMLGTTNPTQIFNYFGPFTPSGYVQSALVTFAVSNYSGTNLFSFRTQSPVFGGYPLVGHTNTSIASSLFQRISVSTNLGGSILMYATNSVDNAPAGASYNSPYNRSIKSGIAETNLVSPSGYPFVPILSAATGSNAFNGTLAAAPIRASVIDLASGFSPTNTSAYGTNVPVINDSFGNFRVVGNPARYSGNSTFEILSRVEGANNYLFVNTIPDSTLTATNLSFSTNNYASTINYEIGVTNNLIRIRRGTNAWVNLPSFNNNYLLVRSDGGNPSNPAKPSGRITMRDNDYSRFAVIPVRNSDLLALQSNHVTLAYPAAGFTEPEIADVCDGAVVYLKDSYGVNGGVGFVLLGANLAGAAKTAMNYLSPTNGIRLRALVNNLPLVQISPSSALSILSAPSGTAMQLQLTNSHRLRFRGSTNQTPLLVHMDQRRVNDQNGFQVGDTQWRRVLLVMNQGAPINVNTNASALTFSYLDDGEFDLGTVNGASTRPLFVSIEGLGTNSTDVSFQAPHSASWQLGMTLRNANITFSPSTNVTSVWTVFGGFRSNSEMRVSTNTLSLSLSQPSTNASLLESISDRVGWIENWQQ